MHDKAVRRRRAVLVVLVAASLILLTAYFGESSDGRLHSVQRGALGVLSPIQEGASRVLKPVRDLFGWFGDTVDAKDQRDRAIKERDAYRKQVVALQTRINESAQQAKLDDIDSSGGMRKYKPVDPRGVGHSPHTRFPRRTVNKGTGDGGPRGGPPAQRAPPIG